MQGGSSLPPCNLKCTVPFVGTVILDGPNVSFGDGCSEDGRLPSLLRIYQLYILFFFRTFPGGQHKLSYKHPAYSHYLTGGIHHVRTMSGQPPL